ncbi:MAG: hypothetical protein KAH77_06635 [Thiomargarita sp.]|nr:hypothetical protein [Thiomargarita sp.]
MLKQQLLDKIVLLFEKAEISIKKAEQLSSNLSIPSINELRYAGYHIIKAISVTQSVAISEKEMAMAEKHCKRAIYDATEIGIIYLLESIEIFQKDYSTSTNIIPVLSDYVDLCKQVENAKNFIANIKNNNHNNRDQYYEECAPYYEELNKIKQTLTCARPEINKLNDSERKKTRIVILQIVISILAIIIILFIGLAKIFY